jgi:hypothetical protein
MSTEHATSAELELYVLGALTGVRAERVEAHCVRCAECAAALAGEARLETAFEQVATRSARASTARATRAAAYGAAAAGLLAMAAAVAVWVGRMPGATGEGGATASAPHHASMDDGAILDAFNDALDGG